MALNIPASQHPSKCSLSLRSSILITSFVLIIIFKSCNSLLAQEYLYPEESHKCLNTYHFVISEGTLQPDNFRQTGYLINGQFPGPTIFLKQFDTLRVEVHNRMSRPTALHFHGLLQEHTVASDGVSWVTQDPIPPNGTYCYEVQVGVQTGTFMYHGHIGYDSIFIKGLIIIRDNPSYWGVLGRNYRYDWGYEHSFLLGEIYHYDLHQFEKDVVDVWKGKPPIKSLHINGYSYGEWKDNNGDAPGYEVKTVEPGKTYRFRVVSLASESMLLFRIDGHIFCVIEMDGILTFPIWTDRLEINSGQRYSAMVTMNQKVANYWIHLELLSPFSGGPDNGRAILNYIGAANPEPFRKQLFRGPTVIKPPTSWILPYLTPNRLLPQSEVYPLPRKHNRRILIDSMQRKDSKGVYKILINGHHYQDPKINYLSQVHNGTDIAKNSRQVYEIIEGEVVDIVFQNRVMDDGPCIQHPWHLHGHSFWLVAEGPDEVDFNRLDHIIDRNLLNGRLQFRDVVTMFPYQRVENTTSGAACGWVVIRFIANNPGVWIAHCHINTHFLLGKKFVLYEHGHDNPRLINE